MAAFVETSESSARRIELSGILQGSNPEDVYLSFIDPDWIRRWWADDSEVEPVVDGRLIVRWPSMGWTMPGRYMELVPSRLIEFTWSWDHEPDTPTRTVRVRIEADAAGARLTLTHGEYGAEDIEERKSHLEGWQHFLPRLAAVLSSAS